MFYVIFLLIILLLLVSLLYNQNNNNNKFYIASSTINGLGVFTKYNILKNTILLEAIDKDKNVTKLGSKINHCNNPNTELIKINNKWFLTSIKNIDMDSEITADYNNTPDFIKKADSSWSC